jgi:hypothetical protein
MGFEGQIATIQCGIGGLHTDDPHTIIPISNLVRANNVALRNGLIEKEPGSRRFNATAFGGGVYAAFDWWPDDVTQRLIAVTGAGRVYKMPDYLTQTEITAAGTAPSTLSPSTQTHIMSCGQESAGRAKKFMIFTGKNPVQVVSGDGSTRTDLASPTADWAGSHQPSFGFMHRGRVIAMGNANNPHGIYISDDDDHENFATGGAQYSVYPGEGERLFSGFVYKGRAFLLKYPRGVYFIDDTNPNVTQWYIQKVSSTFGAASAHPAIEVLNDLLCANITGSITSLNATQAFGDVESGDILSRMRCEDFMRKTTSPSGNLDRHALYYEDRKLGLFTYRSAGGMKNDRIMYVDFSMEGNPRVTWSTKDQANCLALMKDVYGVPRPIYGADDGYIYQMDQNDRDVGGSAYTAEFMTPDLDFGQSGPGLADQNKLYKFLELTFESCGRWNAYVEVFIDGKSVETIAFPMSHGPVLGTFRVGKDRVGGRTLHACMKPLHGMGRRIAFRVYNGGYRENFKIASIRVYYRLSGQQQQPRGK